MFGQLCEYCYTKSFEWCSAESTHVRAATAFDGEPMAVVVGSEECLLDVCAIENSPLNNSVYGFKHVWFVKFYRASKQETGNWLRGIFFREIDQLSFVIHCQRLRIRIYA